jgi:hypothetical protein
MPDAPLTGVQMVGLWGLIVTLISVALLWAEPRFNRTTQPNRKEHTS